MKLFIAAVERRYLQRALAAALNEAWMYLNTQCVHNNEGSEDLHERQIISVVINKH